MVMHELMHYSISNNAWESPRSVRRKLPNSNSAVNMDKMWTSKIDIKRTGSFVVGQKLRESKWFVHEETKILCAVLETGFIVETKNQNEEKSIGVAVWTPGFEKSKDPRHIKIYTLIYQKGRYKVKDLNLLEFWPNGSRIRISNQNDKNETPNSEEVIRHQILYAINTKPKWHNVEHFPYFCRYGQPVNYRTKHTSDVKWGYFGLNAGLVLLRRSRRSTNRQ